MSSCPTCGTAVEIVGGEEGTMSYRPITAAEPLREFARWIVAAEDSTYIRGQMTLTEIIGRAQTALEESERSSGRLFTKDEVGEIAKAYGYVDDLAPLGAEENAAHREGLLEDAIRLLDSR